jgi:hypothetical protein
LTPASTAEAVSMDSDTFPLGERLSVTGVAHKMQPRSAVAPAVTAFDIATS